MVLDLQTNDDAPLETRIGGCAVPVIPFAVAVTGLVALAMDSADYDFGEQLIVLLPRVAFDRAADDHGAARVDSLSLRLGAAHDDTVLAHLGACLGHALQLQGPSNLVLVDHITLALTLHLAQRYGGMQASHAPEHGGLAAWQLRLARKAFRNLDGPMSIDAIATECGLSTGQFSRAFSRSTGLAPHRWLILRRIEVAKDMIREKATPLAQIALACGFSDQSHFTRAFAAATGLTPGRWRGIREGAPSVNRSARALPGRPVTSCRDIQDQGLKSRSSISARLG